MRFWCVSRSDREAPVAGGPDKSNESVSDAYVQLIKDQLTEERARKTSIEQRGVGVITTSGALVTLLFGLAALATKTQATYTLPDLARWALLFAVAAFLLASCLGLATNWPRNYDEVMPDAMRSFIEPGASAGAEPEPARRAAKDQIAIIESARAVNGLKARQLIAAMSCEVIGLLVVGLAVANVLWTK